MRKRNETHGVGIDLSAVDKIVKQIGRGRECAIPILQAVQVEFRYLPNEALVRVCEISDIAPAQIEGIASFYGQFRRMPVGEHLISVCHGTACHVASAESIMDAVRRHLRIEGDSDTDLDRLFTVQKVSCLGCCSLAPVMRIDGRTYGRLTPQTAPLTVQRFLKESVRRRKARRTVSARAGQAAKPLAEIRIGLGSCCIASGSMEVKERLEQEIADLGIDAVVRCGSCVGMCHRVPLVEYIGPDGKRARYGNVKPNAAKALLRRHAQPQGALRKAVHSLRRIADRLIKDSAWESVELGCVDPKSAAVCAFVDKQKHIVLEGCGEMDPLDIDEYIAMKGYSALERAVKSMSPEDIINQIRASRLRGRGGAGFSTADKWDMVRRQPEAKRYILMNGDEGDPGAFMDRMLLESYPHRVLEGIAITARAVGADEGYLYIRAEYPLALQRVREALRQAESRGFLGERIPGSDFTLRLRVMEGAGAFVCGEETAMIASLQGNRGQPRFRPPYPAEKGLWNKPTCINNVETYANVPWIIRNGPEAFAAIGSNADSRGTKVFALAGRINRGGLIEVPMGITIREIVEGIGGGIRDGRTFKAVQIGGPSGGCVPATLADTRIDYTELARTGAIMGSGGLVVMDDTSCMVDMARYFLRFTQSESCGKCTFCRIGTKRMLEILDRICEGRGSHGDLQTLEVLANHVRSTSLCGLGRTAPNPVLTTLRYFRDEYEAHIQGRCPAKKCRALIAYRITDKCIGCTRCAQNCPAEAIEPRPYEKHVIDAQKCVRCGTCKAVCPSDAVEVE